MTTRLVGDVFLVWAAAVGVASVIVHAFVPWWKTPMGRHLMAYMAVIAIVLVLAVIRVFFAPAGWFDILRVVVFAGVPLVMTQRLWMQLKAQRDVREESRHTGYHENGGE